MRIDLIQISGDRNSLGVSAGRGYGRCVLLELTEGKGKEAYNKS